jgi:hypothetical protein
MYEIGNSNQVEYFLAANFHFGITNKPYMAIRFES